MQWFVSDVAIPDGTGCVCHDRRIGRGSYLDTDLNSYTNLHRRDHRNRDINFNTHSFLPTDRDIDPNIASNFHSHRNSDSSLYGVGSAQVENEHQDRAELCLEYFDETTSRRPCAVNCSRTRSVVWEEVEMFGNGLRPCRYENRRSRWPEYNTDMQRYLIVADLGLYDVLFTSLHKSCSAIWHSNSAGAGIRAKRVKHILP
jgi:hypothetical protein